MATFNINYTVEWWLKSGLEPQRLVVGLPTYGHSFTLVARTFYKLFPSSNFTL